MIKLAVFYQFAPHYQKLISSIGGGPSNRGPRQLPRMPLHYSGPADNDTKMVKMIKLIRNPQNISKIETQNLS